MKQVILDLKSLLDISNVSLVSKYQSRIIEFRKLPPKLRISLPTFEPVKINKEKIMKVFGSLTPLSIETDEQGYNVPVPGAESSHIDWQQMFLPTPITDLYMGYGYLYGVSCLSDDEIWTHGEDDNLKLYNLKGELLKSVRTKSGNVPTDIAVTKSGDLVYTDYNDRSINILSDLQVDILFTPRGWRSRGLCNMSSGDLLVILVSDDEKHSKVVRYSGSTE